MRREENGKRRFLHLAGFMHGVGPDLLTCWLRDLPAVQIGVLLSAIRKLGTGPMTEAWQKTESLPQISAKPLDWRKRMSDNIAYALLVYTVLQIFVTMSALKAEGSSLLPYLALVILVGAIIPSCRRFERRWNRLSNEQAADPSLSRYYRHDQLVLWLLAIGLPFGITGMFRLLALYFS
jgi:hypothetical protein